MQHIKILRFRSGVTGRVLMFALMIMALTASRGGAAVADGPKSLEDCIGYALDNAPGLKKLKLEHGNQQLSTEIERAAFAFNLETVSSHSIQDENDLNAVTLSKHVVGGIDVAATVHANDSTVNGDPLGSFSLTISKLILGGGTISESLSGIRKSLLVETILQNTVHRETRNLLYNVKRLYYQVMQSRQTLKVQELKLDTAKKNLEIAIAREKPLDIETARIEVPSRQADVVQMRRQIDSTLDELKVLIGMDAQAKLEIKDRFDFKAQKIDTAADIAFALENHEDVLNDGLRLKVLKIDQTVLKSHLWPKVTVFASHAQLSVDHFDMGGVNSNVVGVSAKWEIGRRSDKARYKQALNSVEEQKLTSYETVQEKTRQIRDLSKDLQQLSESITLQEERVRVGGRLVELYKDRYDNGEIDILEYIRSQNDLEDSRVNLINLKTSYMQQLAAYQLAVGRG